MRLILIDSRAGQWEDCSSILSIWVFILLVLIFDGFYRSMSEIKATSLSPEK